MLAHARLDHEHPRHVLTDVFVRTHPAGLSLHTGHLSRSLPFSPFWRDGLYFGCHAVQTACEAGELHYMRVRHAGDTPSEGLV